MRGKIFLFLTMASTLCFAQISFPGNGNSGFGGVIGTGTLDISLSGSVLTFSLTKVADAQLLIFQTIELK